MFSLLLSKSQTSDAFMSYMIFLTQVSLPATAPLTNLALTTRIDPTIHQNLKGLHYEREHRQYVLEISVLNFLKHKYCSYLRNCIVQGCPQYCFFYHMLVAQIFSFIFLHFLLIEHQQTEAVQTVLFPQHKFFFFFQGNW